MSFSMPRRFPHSRAVCNIKEISAAASVRKNVFYVVDLSSGPKPGVRTYTKQRKEISLRFCASLTLEDGTILLKSDNN